MRTRRWAAALLVAGAALAGCRDAAVERQPTAVLGGTAPQANVPTLSDADGAAIPPPPAPAGAHPRLARTAEGQALAVWVHDRQVLAATWNRAEGWVPAQALERIHGEPREPQLVSNGQGVAMAVWHHQVGNIHSLRFSRFEAATGWSVPDVLPGALPKPAVAGMAPGQNAPRLEMDAEGNVLARWPSGLRANAFQAARHVPGQGWETPSSEPVASAPLTSAGPAPAPER